MPLQNTNTAISSTVYKYNFSLTFLLSLVLIFFFTLFLAKTIKTLVKEKKIKKTNKSLILSLILCTAIIIYSIITKTTGMLFSQFTIYYMLITLMLNLAIQFFKKTILTLLTITFISFLTLLILFIRSITAYTGNTKIGTIHILEKKNNITTLQIDNIVDNKITDSYIIKLKGIRFGLIIYQVIFNDLAVFLGSKTRYAWLGMTAFDASFKQTDLLLFKDFYKRKIIFESMEKKEIKLPFIKSIQADIPTKLAIQQKTYEIFIENDGGCTIKTK